MNKKNEQSWHNNPILIHCEYINDTWICSTCRVANRKCTCAWSGIRSMAVEFKLTNERIDRICTSLDHHYRAAANMERDLEDKFKEYVTNDKHERLVLLWGQAMKKIEKLESLDDDLHERVALLENEHEEERDHDVDYPKTVKEHVSVITEQVLEIKQLKKVIIQLQTIIASSQKIKT